MSIVRETCNIDTIIGPTTARPVRARGAVDGGRGTWRDAGQGATRREPRAPRTAAAARPLPPRPPRPPALGRGPVFVDFLIADYNFPSFERLSYSRSIYDRKIKFVTFIRHVFKTYIHFQ